MKDQVVDDDVRGGMGIDPILLKMANRGSTSAKSARSLREHQRGHLISKSTSCLPQRTHRGMLTAQTSFKL